jgi:hypothetical protein
VLVNFHRYSASNVPTFPKLRWSATFLVAGLTVYDESRANRPFSIPSFLATGRMYRFNALPGLIGVPLRERNTQFPSAITRLRGLADNDVTSLFWRVCFSFL